MKGVPAKRLMCLYARGGLSATQWLKGDSQPKSADFYVTPRAVRVAACLFVATAVFGIVFIALNWSRHSLAWSTSLPALLIAALNVLIAVKLLQLRYWALILARILTIWLAAGYIISFATGQFAGDPPVVR